MSAVARSIFFDWVSSSAAAGGKSSDPETPGEIRVFVAEIGRSVVRDSYVVRSKATATPVLGRDLKVFFQALD